MTREPAIVAAMAAGSLDPAIQLTQTRYRLALADGWDIRPGASVLEIGCGQGDMTAVLAAAVGEHGRVVGLDNAEPSYGAPVTIGESAQVLLDSPLGARIDIRFGTDVLDERFDAHEFDHVVLSHCAWYFDSIDRLRNTLRAVGRWAPRLCFAEWDLRPDHPDQLAHLLAVLVQGQLAAHGLATGGNVRTPFSREVMLRVLDETGWRVDRQRTVDTAGLQDADWEVGAALGLASLFELPGREFLAGQLDVLRAVASASGNRPLPAYRVVASLSDQAFA
ncbi:MAG TPA: methyltransferase domain-containing protein [Actinophytocola sp.]|nr:methyltransferase domain-containing protein [Actinophytocola sp.]